MQTTQINIRLEPDQAELVRRLSKEAGLAVAAVSGMLLKSALCAVERHGLPVPFPIVFEIAGGDGKRKS